MMNGVEAAASLFGSEEPGSDPFAALGAAITESTSIAPSERPADDLFFSNVPAPSQDADPFHFLPNGENHSTDFTALSGSLPDHSHAHEATSSSTQHVSHSGHWMDDNTLSGNGETYQTPQSGPQSLATLSSDTSPKSYTTYDPASSSTYVDDSSDSSHNQPSNALYVPRVDPVPMSQQRYGAKVAPIPAPYDTSTSRIKYPPYSSGPSWSEVASSSQVVPHTISQLQYSNISSAPSSYDHPGPYSSYTPGAVGKVTSNSTHPALPMSSTISPYYAVAPPPPVKATIMRPKVSNAYDPPFIPTLPNRRTSRQALNTYQSLANSKEVLHESYGASTGSSPISDAAYLTQAEFRQAPVNPPSASSPRESDHGRHDLPGSNPSQFAHAQGDGHSDLWSSEIGQSYTLPGHSDNPLPQEVELANTLISYNTDFKTTEPSPSPPRIPEFSSIHPTSTEEHGASKHSSVDPTISQTISPHSVPLPFSPSTQAKELQEIENVTSPVDDIANEGASQQSQFVKQDLPANNDLYAPRSNHNTSNYIPRTSSPLSVGRPNDAKKGVALTRSNGLTSSYSSGSKSLGMHPPVPPLKASSLHPHDDQSPGAHWSENQRFVQDVHVMPTSVQYAPSPSLIGANDPLSRTSARAPVVTFGFGGKLITCFHGMPGLNAGFDVALSARTTSELKIHNMRKIIPESALNNPGAAYPGPLFSDPGSSSISLVRSGQSTQTKTKKAGVLSYLSGRVSEIQQGLGYLSNVEKQLAENKLIIIKLLSIMVENDGRLLGNPQSDTAVRSTLVPRLESLTTGLQDGLSLQANLHPTPLDETPISVTTLRPSALDRIEELLLQGDRRQAYIYAAEQKLWAHAMVIASSVDKESWREVVNDFLRNELGAKEDAPISRGSSSYKNRDNLRVAYSLYSGQGIAAVQELAPVNLFQRASGRLQAPVIPITSSLTPKTPNFHPPQPNISLPPECLVKWAETAAMILSSPLTPETAATLTTLGDQLHANDMTEAAHACYLLSSQTSLFGGFGHPTARITLLGAKSPVELTRNFDPLVFTEILEFALSLVPAVKGQEAFHGLPHLQAYRFVRAISLAETGDIQLANRYCDAIAASLSNNSPYITVALLEQLQGLQQRLLGVFHGDKSGSWITGKISKPSLDSIGGWLEGRFAKLVTGEADTPTPTSENARSNDQPFSGPFAHYSTISSTTPSARSSPQPMPTNFAGLPPQRTTSAMATSSPFSQVQIERSSSAMGYLRQKPAMQVAGVNTGSISYSTISSSQSSPTGYVLNGHPRLESDSNGPKAEEWTTPLQKAAWWDSLDDQSASNSTPTATTFMQVEEPSLKASEGFISLMDSSTLSIGPGLQAPGLVPQSRSSSQYTIEEDPEDDLGLGNSKPKLVKAKVDEEIKDDKPMSAEPPAQEAKEAPAPASGSWFSRWWKKNEASSGPVKASLGEESTFYYDKEQKRWVNKKASSEASTSPPPSLPPPPTRAQTASPGMTGPKSHLSPSMAPPRSASAIDLTAEPPAKAPMRIRSNLAPPTESAPSTPTGSRMLPNASGLPPGRPKSGAAKRNLRSRYVDVFQQEGPPA